MKSRPLTQSGVPRAMCEYVLRTKPTVRARPRSSERLSPGRPLVSMVIDVLEPMVEMRAVGEVITLRAVAVVGGNEVLDRVVRPPGPGEEVVDLNSGPERLTAVEASSLLHLDESGPDSRGEAHRSEPNRCRRRRSSSVARRSTATSLAQCSSINGRSSGPSTTRRSVTPGRNRTTSRPSRRSR